MEPRERDNRVSRFLTDKKFILIFLGGMLIGMLSFFYVYGFHVLDVRYDAWLLRDGDMPQHYLGWVFYRRSPWYFPLGMMDNLFYPNLCSVVYTDSIPLFAVFFKALSPVLPETFQYFGLFGLLCFMLQGGFAALLIGKLTEGVGNAATLYLRSLMGCVFFVFATPVLQRMYGDSVYTRHTATAAHFLILAALTLWVFGKSTGGLRKTCALWGTLAAATALIHLTLLPIVAGIFAGYLLNRFLVEKKMRSIAYLLLAFVSMVILPLFLMGAFYYPFQTDAEGLGDFTANLNTFLNPMGNSSVLKDLPTSAGQYEGMSYAGLGILILAALAVLCFLLRAVREKRGPRWLKARILRAAPEKRYALICAGLVFLVFAVLAVSVSVEWNEHVLLQIRLPAPIYKFFSMFRASGRFAWADLYLLMLAAVVLSARWMEHNAYIVVLYLCMLVQLCDLRYKIADIRESHKERVEYASGVLISPLWQQIAGNYSRLYMMDSGVFVGAYGYWEGYDIQYALAKLALDHGMVMNGFHTSRNYLFKEEADRLYWEAVERGDVSEDALYVFHASHLPEKKYLNFYVIDNIIIGTLRPLEGVAEYQY